MSGTEQRQFNLPDHLTACDFEGDCGRCGKNGTLWTRISGYEEPEVDFHLCSACAQERLAAKEEELDADERQAAKY